MDDSPTKLPNGAIPTLDELKKRLLNNEVIWEGLPPPGFNGSPVDVRKTRAYVRDNGSLENGWSINTKPFLYIPFSGGRAGFYFTNFWLAYAHAMHQKSV
jgi:hypothetical protein